MKPDITKIYRNLSIVSKAVLWFTFCSFFLKGMGFITGPIFTRLLSPEEYGILTLYVTYEQIFLIFATWEIQIGAYQRGLFKYERNWNQYAVSTLVLVNLMTIVFFVIVCLFFRPISEFTRMNTSTIVLLFLYLMTNPAYMCWMTRKRTTYEYKKVVGFTVLSTVLSIAVSILAIFEMGRTAQMRFNATLLVSTSFYIYFYLDTFFQKGIKLEWKEIKPQWIFMLSYEAPLVLHSLSYLVLGQADRVMIGKMVGDRQAAFYGVAYTLASAVTILQTSLNEALAPWRFQKLKEENYEKVGQVTNMLLILLGVLILAIVLIAPEMLKLLFTEDYYEAVWCIPPVSVSIFFMFLYSTFVAVESYYEKTAYIMYVSVACGLVNVGLNYLLIPVLGYIVCGYTTLFSYVLFAFLHYYCMKMVCRKVIPGIRIFSIPTIVAISAIVVGCSLIFTILYLYLFVRCILLFCMMIIAFMYKDRIKEIFTLLKRRHDKGIFYKT